MQQRLFQCLQRGELLLIDRFEASGLGREIIELSGYFNLLIE